MDGTITPSRANASTIDESWFNQLINALIQDIVPRNASGVATDNGASLGTSSIKFLNAYLNNLYLYNGTRYVKHKAPAGMLTDYDVQWPGATPAANSLLQMSPGGIITFNDPQALSPSGSILAFGGATPAPGWLLCDGMSYLRTDYQNLFNAIGTAYGAADATHFNVPDLRGRFLRGLDSGASRDPDNSTRVAMNAGGNTGNALGSIQGSAFASHNHTGLTSDDSPDHSHHQGHDLNPNGNHGDSPIGNNYVVGLGSNQNAGYTQGASVRHKHSIGPDGGSETRPINAYVNYIIKT